MAKLVEITLDVNGREETLRIDERWTLLKVLREELDLTGAKPGCNTGDCGACKVIMDGEAVNSCTVLARKAVGKKITTIEGLGGPGALHPVQEAFVEAGAVQCGYCTPGMVLTAKALLDKRPHPDEREIREAVHPNICRCTGYVKIVDAIERVSGGGDEERGL